MASATRSGMITPSHLRRAGRAPNRRACAQTSQYGLASNGMTTAEPAQFREAVAAMNATTVRPEIELGPIGPPRAHQLELRASWTATTLELGPHVQAFCEVLEHAAGLPPAGVTDLGSRTRA